MRGAAPALAHVLAFILALALTGLVLFALAIGSGVATCPKEAGAFSCVALVRPPLRALGPLPVTEAAALGAAAQAMAALLLLVRGAKLPFARDAAILSALGAGFALGLQPLAVLVARHACPVCLLALALELALALLLAHLAGRAGARRRPILLAFALALFATGAASSAQGVAQRARDEDAIAALAALERADARLVLVERPGCAYCEALRLDVLARPEVRARLARTGLARREARDGEPAPILLARDARGGESARHLGFTAEVADYEAVLAAAER